MCPLKGHRWNIFSPEVLKTALVTSACKTDERTSLPYFWKDSEVILYNKLR